MSELKERIKVRCPCCEATLVVDPATGLVLNTARKKVDFSLDQAVQRQKEFRSKADELFQKAFDKEKDRTTLLEKKFQEALESKEELPDPERPFDLD